MRKIRKRYFVEYTCTYRYVFRISYHRSIREMVIIARNNPCDCRARVVRFKRPKIDFPGLSLGMLPGHGR